MKPPGPAAALTFAPDGKTLVRGAYGAILIGDTPLSVPLAQVHDLAFSPDGKTLAVSGGTPGAKGTFLLLDWPARKVRATLAGHTDTAVGIAFAPDGKTFATVGHDRQALLWDADGKRRASLDGHAGPILDVAFSPDGADCLTAGGDGTLRVFEMPTGRLRHALSFHTDRIHAIAFRPAGDGPAVCATASRDRTARLWQPKIGRMMRILRGHDAGVLCLAWSPDGTRLYTGGEEGIVRVFDANSDTLQTSWHASNDWILRLLLSPDGRTLLTGDSTGTVRRFEAHGPVL